MNAIVGNRITALIAANRMENEPDVNGVWNTILSLYFPNQDLGFVIAPEASPGGTNRTDFLIRKFEYQAGNTLVSSDYPVLLFEGKRKNGDHFDEIRAQLRRYFDGSNFDTCWAVGARGQEVKFWRYVKANAEPKMKAWKVSNAGVAEEAATDSKDTNVFKVIDWNSPQPPKSFVPILEYMKRYPRAPAVLEMLE